MNNLRRLKTPEINQFSGYLEALCNFIVGADYVTHFGAVGFELLGQTFAAEGVIKEAYPNSEPEAGSIIERSSFQMVERVNQALNLPDPPYSEPGFRDEIQKRLLEGYWRHLKACIDYESAQIYEYEPCSDRDDELSDFIYWGFTFLIFSKGQRCLIIHGAASD